jgi:hypothetical protein
MTDTGQLIDAPDPRQRKTRTGKRSLATRATLTRLVELVEQGSYLSHAAAAVGLHIDTVYGWLSKGTNERTARTDPDYTPNRDFDVYVRFADVYDRARATAATRLVGYAHKHAQGGYTLRETTRTFRDDDGREVVEVERTIAGPDGRVALEMLNRMHPAEWGRRQAIAVELPGGRPSESQDDVASAQGMRLSESLRRAAEERRELPAPEGDDVADAEIIEEYRGEAAK